MNEEEDDIPKIGLAAKKGAGKGLSNEEIPKIGRGKMGFKIPIRQLFMIGMTLITLIVLLTMQRTCANGVGKAFNSFAPPPTVDGGTVTYVKAPPLPPDQIPTPTPTPAPQPQPAPTQPLRPIPSTPGR